MTTPHQYIQQLFTDLDACGSMKEGFIDPADVKRVITFPQRGLAAGYHTLSEHPQQRHDDSEPTTERIIFLASPRAPMNLALWGIRTFQSPMRALPWWQCMNGATIYRARSRLARRVSIATLPC